MNHYVVAFVLAVPAGSPLADARDVELAVQQVLGCSDLLRPDADHALSKVVARLGASSPAGKSRIAVKNFM